MLNRKELTSVYTNFVTKFTNLLMMHGKKSKALSILSKSLRLLKKYIENLFSKQNMSQINKKTVTLDYLIQAVNNVKPSLEVRKKKVSGITRQIPAIVSRHRQETLAIRWIIEAARKRKKKNSKPFHECLADELLDAFQKKGEPRQKRDALHRTAESNRTFLRYRWW